MSRTNRKSTARKAATKAAPKATAKAKPAPKPEPVKLSAAQWKALTRRYLEATASADDAAQADGRPLVMADGKVKIAGVHFRGWLAEQGEPSGNEAIAYLRESLGLVGRAVPVPQWADRKSGSKAMGRYVGAPRGLSVKGLPTRPTRPVATANGKAGQGKAKAPAKPKAKATA